MIAEREMLKDWVVAGMVEDGWLEGREETRYEVRYEAWRTMLGREK